MLFRKAGKKVGVKSPKTEAFISTAKDHYAWLSAFVTLNVAVICLFNSAMFYNQFDINIFSFSGFLEIYRSVLTPAILRYIFGCIYFYICFHISGRMLVGRWLDHKTTKMVRFSKIAALILIPVGLLFIPLADVDRIKAGLTTRWDVRTADSTYTCHEIIGGSNDYLFLWNVEKKQTIILPRSKLNEVRFDIEEAPDIRDIPHRWESSAWVAAEMNERFEARKMWMKKISALCGQTVPWRP